MNTVLLFAPKDNVLYNFRRELIQSLKEQYRVILVCPYGSKIDFFTSIGCEFIDVNVERQSRNPLYDIKLLIQYKRLLKTIKPDIVLSFTTKSSIYAGIACRLTGTKYIVNNSGLIQTGKYSLLGFILHFLYKLGYNGAECIMCQNSQEKIFFSRVLRNNMRFRVLPGSGVNIDYFSFQPYPKERDELVFNFVGRIIKEKGIEEFLECAKVIKTKYPKCRFVIYGEYDSKDPIYKKHVEDYAERGIVEYAGVVLDMRPAILNANAAIHPSYAEGMTNVILEHGAMGRPSIASNIPGCNDCIDEGITGLLFKCRDVSEMIARIEDFILMPIERKEKMGIASRKKMVMEFDRSIVINSYLEEIVSVFE